MEKWDCNLEQYKWDDTPQEQRNKPKIEWKNPEIFQLSIREYDQLILNKLDYIISLLSSVLEM